MPGLAKRPHALLPALAVAATLSLAGGPARADGVGGVLVDLWSGLTGAVSGNGPADGADAEPAGPAATDGPVSRGMRRLQGLLDGQAAAETLHGLPVRRP